MSERPTPKTDAAREEISSIRNALSHNGQAVGDGDHDYSIIEMVENLMQSKDYFVRKSDSLERERDEAREVVSRIEEIFCDGEDTHDDWMKMGNIARDYLKGLE